MSPNDRKIWIDGELVPWAEATIHILSHATQRGVLVFDYMSVHDNVAGPAIFRLRPHLERFVRSCELVGLPLQQHVEELSDATRLTVRANPGSHSVKISAYLPSIEVELVPQNDHVAVAIAAYDVAEDIIKQNPGHFHWRDELNLWIEKEKRNRRHDILAPQAKVSAGYGPLMSAKWNARRAGYDEILLLDEDGWLAESPTTNLFLVSRQGTLETPPADGVLHGITRDSLIDIARAEGIEVRERRLHPDALFDAAEVFLTATSAGVWPVVSIDERPIGDGSPGAISLRLRERLATISRGEDERFLHWLEPA